MKHYTVYSTLNTSHRVVENFQSFIIAALNAPFKIVCFNFPFIGSDYSFFTMALLK